MQNCDVQISEDAGEEENKRGKQTKEAAWR
jgi:hypothetical protein